MAVLYYAVEITTDTVVTDYDYGITLGMFRFITGRPGYLGVDNFPKWEDGSDNEGRWYESFLIEDGLSFPSRMIDISVSGEYGTLSGFSFKIANYNKFHDFLITNSIYILGRRVRAFVVIDNVFYQIWDGICTNFPYTETQLTFECKDSYKNIHKLFPPVLITDAGFTGAGSGDQGAAIPVTVGDATYVKLTDVGDKSEYLDLVLTDDFEYSLEAASKYKIIDRKTSPGERYQCKSAAATTIDASSAYDGALYTLYTKGKVFAANALVGYYLVGMAGNGLDTEYACLIKSNTATSADLTAIRVHGILNGTTVTTATNHTLAKGAVSDSDTWWFGVLKMANTMIASYNGIESFQKDSRGSYVLYSYSEDKKDFEPVNNLISDLGVTGVSGYAYPAIKVLAKEMSREGEVRYDYYFPPSQFSMYAGFSDYGLFTVHDGVLSTVEEWARLSSTNTQAIIDRKYDTYIQYKSYQPNQKLHEVIINVVIPRDKLFNEEFDELYVGFEFRFDSNVTAKKLSAYCNIEYLDPYLKQVDGMGGQVNFPGDAAQAGAEQMVTMMPPAWWETGHAPGAYVSSGYFWGQISEYVSSGSLEVYDYRSKVKIDSSALAMMKSGALSPVVRCTFGCSMTATGNVTADFYDIGFIGVKKVDVISNDLYCRCKGEISYGVSGINPVGTQSNSVYGTFKLLLETYDKYGVTGALNAPWIDYSNLPTYRTDWVVGRQVTEQKSSYEYLNELCKQSFVGMFPTRKGNRKLVAWRDGLGSVATIATANIVRDSIVNFQRTESSKIFNDFVIEYAYNQATDSFDRKITITKTNMTTFPLSNQNWTEYVAGVAGNSYADAKAMWEIAQNAYDVCHITQTNPSDTRQLMWYGDAASFANVSFIGASVDDAAYKFLQNLVTWTALQKEKLDFSLPMTATNIALELLDKIGFSESFFTNGVTRTGWITGIEIDTKNDRINIEATLQPVELEEDNLIIERGIPLNTDTIEESGAQTNQIEET